MNSHTLSIKALDGLTVDEQIGSVKELPKIEEPKLKDKLKPGEEPKLKVEPSIEDRIREALESPEGLKLSVKILEKDPETLILYQGLRENVWGRVTSGKIYIYNSRLTRLLNRYPSTSDLKIE